MICLQVDGLLRGISLWRVVPAGRTSIVQHRFTYELSDRRWLVPWALLGRWAVLLQIRWQMRRLKARVEDTVGSSSFGVPLPVSRYALAAGAALAGLFLAVLTVKASLRRRSGG